MNPLDPNKPAFPSGNGSKQPIIPVVNTTTGEEFLCQRNLKSLKFEVLKPIPTIRTVNLQPKFSRVCEISLEVMVFATNSKTKKLHRYVFENNDFVRADECSCNTCCYVDPFDTMISPSGRAFGDEQRFVDCYGEALINIGITWTKCHQTGSMNIFVHANGSIGIYRKTKLGMQLFEMNMDVKMLPTTNPTGKEVMDSSFKLLDKQMCPHLSVVTFMVSRVEGNVEQLVFNKTTDQFEMIRCEKCMQDRTLKKGKTVDDGCCMEVWAGKHCEKYTVIYRGDQEKLTWKVFAVRPQSWEYCSKPVMDCRAMSTRDLLLRYHYERNNRGASMNSMRQADNVSRKLAFIEDTTMGRVFWMMDSLNAVKPFELMYYPNSAEQTLIEIDPFTLHRKREEIQRVLDPDYKNSTDYSSVVRRFTELNCDHCAQLANNALKNRNPGYSDAGSPHGLQTQRGAYQPYGNGTNAYQYMTVPVPTNYSNYVDPNVQSIPRQYSNYNTQAPNYQPMGYMNGNATAAYPYYYSYPRGVNPPLGSVAHSYLANPMESFAPSYIRYPYQYADGFGQNGIPTANVPHHRHPKTRINPPVKRTEEPVGTASVKEKTPRIPTPEGIRGYKQPVAALSSLEELQRQLAALVPPTSYQHYPHRIEDPREILEIELKSLEEIFRDNVTLGASSRGESSHAAVHAPRTKKTVRIDKNCSLMEKNQEAEQPNLLIEQKKVEKKEDVPEEDSSDDDLEDEDYSSEDDDSDDMNDEEQLKTLLDSLQNRVNLDLD